MNELKMKSLGSAALALVIRISDASPLHHALRADIARELGLNFQEAMNVLNHLQMSGAVTIGQTLNDYWVKPTAA